MSRLKTIDPSAATGKMGLSDGEIAGIIAHVAPEVFNDFFNIAAGVDIDFPKSRPDP